MRKYLRAIARANMKRAEVQHMNRPRANGSSYFAMNWRKWL